MFSLEQFTKVQQTAKINMRKSHSVWRGGAPRASCPGVCYVQRHTKQQKSL